MTFKAFKKKYFQKVVKMEFKDDGYLIRGEIHQNQSENIIEHLKKIVQKDQEEQGLLFTMEEDNKAYYPPKTLFYFLDMFYYSDRIILLAKPLSQDTHHKNDTKQIIEMIYPLDTFMSFININQK